MENLTRKQAGLYYQLMAWLDGQIQKGAVPQALQVKANNQQVKKVFFTADHHFGHAKIIKYCQRPHFSVEEMNRDLIARWNTGVGETDTVYHLGDFTLGGRMKLKSILCSSTD